MVLWSGGDRSEERRIGAGIALGLAASTQVELTLSKPDGGYAPGETVEVTFLNNLGREIYLPGGAPWGIEDSQGIGVTCWVGTAAIVPVPSGEWFTLRWDQKGCELEPGSGRPVASGTYAAAIMFYDRVPGESKTRKVELRMCFGIGGSPSASCRWNAVYPQPVDGSEGAPWGCGSVGADMLLVLVVLLGLRAIRGSCGRKALPLH